MIRHPFYILLCLAAVLYLATANTRGWSFWQTMAVPFSFGGSGGRSGYYGGFNHK